MIKHLMSGLLLGLLLSGPAMAASISVLIKTSKGDITVALNEEKAPESVKNFLRYVDEGF